MAKKPESFVEFAKRAHQFPTDRERRMQLKMETLKEQIKRAKGTDKPPKTPPKKPGVAKPDSTKSPNVIRMGDTKKKDKMLKDLEKELEALEKRQTSRVKN